MIIYVFFTRVSKIKFKAVAKRDLTLCMDSWFPTLAVVQLSLAEIFFSCKF